jgi:esterase/lipase
MTDQPRYEIDVATYEWSVRIFNTLRKTLKINIRMHHDEGQVQAGDIFLFNHFARVETFIPQYLIHQECGALCRSVAAAQFFNEGDTFSNYLIKLGAIPNDHPRLLPLLAEEILCGRKVIVFPEGGMVKDRQVLDEDGNFSIYSRRAAERRKRHAGAAVLATTLDAYKAAILRAASTNDQVKLKRWSESLDLEDVDQLLEAARRPTSIVPANITFYPLHVDDNILRRGVERYKKGISKRASEELLIETNLLFKVTDMDIRLGDPITPQHHQRWWDKLLINHLARETDNIDELFSSEFLEDRLDKRLANRGVYRHVEVLRNEYMRRMYDAVTINLSHLASRLIVFLCEQGETEVEKDLFHFTLYSAVKLIQCEKQVHLHRGLHNPDAYRGVLDGSCDGFNKFLASTEATDLIEQTESSYKFLAKLREEHAFDEIRLENPIAVYANEAQPVPAVQRSIEKAAQLVPKLSAADRARYLFDDEIRSHQWDWQAFSKPRHLDINKLETATEPAEPYLFIPKEPRSLGVLLVHGFLASPAETRDFGKQLEALGYTVMGVRLKGHGTSPWDLRDRNWTDWLQSVARGYDILQLLVEQVSIVGFSTGGSLTLLHAGSQPEKLAGVITISAPIKVRNRNLIFIPLVYGANRIVRWLSSFEGVMPFRLNESEHPQINYRNIPIRALYEFRRVTEELKRRLSNVRCPIQIVHATEDHVVHPESANYIFERVKSEVKYVDLIPSDRHGILYEAIGETHEIAVAFLEALDSNQPEGIAAPAAAESTTAPLRSAG